jgi:hypothetical protein
LPDRVGDGRGTGCLHGQQNHVSSAEVNHWGPTRAQV